ncbi:hypothetical protein [Lentzea sp. NPDC060358]|uniref:hypothetical protein n=1 Tax=Lentzea sp. NPDC060358 TaxID=3347103 RepID=UPI0036564CA0
MAATTELRTAGSPHRTHVPALVVVLVVVTLVVLAVAPDPLVRTTLSDGPWVQANLVWPMVVVLARNERRASRGGLPGRPVAARGRRGVGVVVHRWPVRPLGMRGRPHRTDRARSGNRAGAGRTGVVVVAAVTAGLALLWVLLPAPPAPVVDVTGLGRSCCGP